LLRRLTKPYASRAFPGSSKTGRLGLQMLLLALPAVLIYANTFQAPFTLDDNINIADNQAVRLVDFTLENLVRAGFDSPLRTRPVAYISFALNYYLHGYELPGYHLVNLLVHIFTGLFLFLFATTTLNLPGYATGEEQGTPLSGTAGQWVAFFTALVWLVHPLHTQSVTYIVQRMNSLAAMFYILALWLYARARFTPGKASRNMLYTGTCLAGILALGSKEIALMLPLTILLYEWFFLQNLDMRWLRKRLPVVAGVFLLIIVAAFLFLGSNPVEYIRDTYKLRDFTLYQRVLTELRVVIYYISLLIYPHPGRLNLEHDFALSLSLTTPPTTLLSLLAIAGLIAGAVCIAKKKRVASFCIICFFSHLVIESSVLGLEIIFEHRTYLPSMFAVLGLVLAGYLYLPFGRWRIILLVILVIIGSKWTYDRNTLWGDEIAFLQDCVKKAPGKWRTHFNLGHALARRDRLDEAIFHFREALKRTAYHAGLEDDTGYLKEPQTDLEAAVRRQHADLLSNLGNALLRDGCLEAAVEPLEKALQLEPRHVTAHTNLGLVYSRMGRSAVAVRLFRRAIEIEPDYVQAHNSLGLELAAMGDVTGAVESYGRAIATDPNFAEAYNNLGIQQARQGRLTDAVSNLSQAIAIQPDYGEAYYNLGLILAGQGRFDAAAGVLEKAVRERPDFTPARESYVANQANRLKSNRDIARLEQEISLDPGNPDLYSKLGDLLRNRGRLEAAVQEYHRALKIGPASTDILKKIAVLYARQGAYEPALNTLQQILSIAPENADACYKMAAVYARQSRPEMALHWLEEALKRGYRDWSAIQADRNLASIRHTQAFTKLKRKYMAFH